MSDTAKLYTRTDHSQLPQNQELLEILKREAQRPIAIGKEKAHYADFQTALEWFDSIGVDTDFFIKEPDSKIDDAILMPESIQEEIAQKTHELVNRNPSCIVPKLQQAADYLGETDSVGGADVIYVFGAPGNYRIEKAIELFKQGLAPKILISGGRPFYKPDAESEADKFREFALANGVPENALIIHNNAISVADNVRGGLNVLDEVGVKYSKLILVTAWFVQRRCWAHMGKYVSKDTQLIRVNASSNPNGGLTENDWFTNEKGIKVVAGEFFKLRVAEILNTA